MVGVLQEGFEEFCKKCGIARQKTTPYTPQQNGVAERMKRTLMEKARSMLSGTRLGQEFWVEAIRGILMSKMGILRKL